MSELLVKTEAHLHTAEVSSCAVDSASAMISACSKAGYGAVIVTDHYLPGQCETPEARDKFLIGYRNAKQMAKQIGMVVLPGMEFRFTRGMEDFLIYGMDEEDFVQLPNDLCNYPLPDFRNYCASNGWLIFQAHPFRNGIQVQEPQFLDGIEVFNGNPCHLNANHNDCALAFARKHCLIELVGTDAHTVRDVGGTCLYIPREMLTPEGIVSHLRTKMCKSDVNDMLSVETQGLSNGKTCSEMAKL